MSAATPIAARACVLTIALTALAPAAAHAARTPLRVQTQNMQGQSPAATIATESPDVVALQNVSDLAALLSALGDQGASYLVGAATADGEVILVSNRDGLAFSAPSQGSGWAAIDGDVNGRPFRFIDADMPSALPPPAGAGPTIVRGPGSLLTRGMVRNARRAHDVDGGAVATVFP